MREDVRTESLGALRLSTSSSRSRFSSGSSGPDSPPIGLQKALSYSYQDNDERASISNGLISRSESEVNKVSKKTTDITSHNNYIRNVDTKNKVDLQDVESTKVEDVKQTTFNVVTLPSLSSPNDVEKDKKTTVTFSKNLKSSDEIKDDDAKMKDNICVQKSDSVIVASAYRGSCATGEVSARKDSLEDGASDDEDVGRSASRSETDDTVDILARLASLQLDNKANKALKVSLRDDNDKGELCSRGPITRPHQAVKSSPYNIQPNVSSSYRHTSGGHVQENTDNTDDLFPYQFTDSEARQLEKICAEHPEILLNCPPPVSAPPSAAPNTNSLPYNIGYDPQSPPDSYVSSTSIFPPSPPYSPSNQSLPYLAQPSPGYSALSPSSSLDSNDFSGTVNQTLPINNASLQNLLQNPMSVYTHNHVLVPDNSLRTTSNIQTESLLHNRQLPLVLQDPLMHNTVSQIISQVPSLSNRHRPIQPNPEPNDPLPCRSVPSATEVLVEKAKANKVEFLNFWAAVAKKKVPELVTPDNDNHTPLIKLIRDKDTSYAVIYSFIERVKKIEDSFSGKNMMVLPYAAQRNDPLVAGYIAETMIRLGINVNERYGEKRNTVLHYVCLWGDAFQATLCQLLQVKTADGKPAFDIDACNDEGYSPLHEAVRSHNGKDIVCSKIVRTLIKFGADPSKQETKSGKTVLYSAVEVSQDPSLVRAILNELSLNEARRLVSIKNYRGDSALHAACSLRNIDAKTQSELVGVLKNYKADCTSQNSDGQAPLELVNLNNKEVVRSMLYSSST